jgi:hypothetical protein
MSNIRLMTSKNINNYLNNYFLSWQSKDIKAIEELLDESCVLVDWEVKLLNKIDILKLNKALFERVDEIHLKIVNQSVTGLVTYSHLDIEIGNEKINVVDKITFNKKNKIIKIEAFKC